MATWPSGKARVCKTLIRGSNPLVASIPQNDCGIFISVYRMCGISLSPTNSLIASIPQNDSGIFISVYRMCGISLSSTNSLIASILQNDCGIFYICIRYTTQFEMAIKNSNKDCCNGKNGCNKATLT